MQAYGAQNVEDFTDALSASVPEAQPLIEDNLDDAGLILHQLMFDLRQLAAAGFMSGDFDLTDRILAVLNTAWVEGDDRVRNAVAASFIDAPDKPSDEIRQFVSTWPDALGAEHARQGGFGA